MSELHFTSDLHLSHELAADMRGFDDVRAMNDFIVYMWNLCVKPEDEVWILGDLALGDREEAFKSFKCMNGKKHLVKGNHDSNSTIRIFQPELESIQDVKLLKRNKKRFWLSHYAHRCWPNSHYGHIHLYGHSHGNLPDDPRVLSMDVGIDTRGKWALGAPYSFEDVLYLMKDKEWKRPESRRDEIQALGLGE